MIYCVYTYTGKFIEVLDNAYEVSTKYKVDIASIYHSCNEDGKCKVVGPDNNVFRWYSDNTNDITIDYTPKRRKINSYNLDGKYVATYKTQSEASKVTGVNKKSIGLCCKFVVERAGNFMFRFSDDFKEGIDIEPYINLRRYNGK